MIWPALIAVFAIYGAVSFGFTVVLSIVWWVDSKDATNRITRPLPEAFPVTTTLEEVR